MTGEASRGVSGTRMQSFTNCMRAFVTVTVMGGGFAGLTEKLDYIEGLAPIPSGFALYPSPLRDDGYDISDYFNIHPDYGTLRDFRSFLRAAHKRGLRVIAELVLNHTSSDHSWFQQSRRAKPNTRRRNMYVWSDTPDRYKDARIIFKDFGVKLELGPGGEAYFWHRFTLISRISTSTNLGT